MNDMEDIIIPFIINKSDVTGKFISLDNVLLQMSSGHDYPELINDLLGNLAIFAAYLGSSLKTQGIISCEILSEEGLINRLVIDYSYGGAMRSHCSFDRDRFSRYLEPSYQDLVMGGVLVVTIDSEAADRYQGVIALEQDSLIDSIGEYFHRSEQIEIHMVLGDGKKNEKKIIRGLVLQKLPAKMEVACQNSETDDQWQRLLLYLSTISFEELMDDCETLLYHLFHEEEIKICEPIQLFFQCRCSREKMARSLTMLSNEEKTALRTEKGTIIRCEFCGTTETFEN